MQINRCWLTLMLSLLWITTVVAADRVLTLEAATAMATKHDPSLAWLAAEAKALREDAIADGQWADPKLKLAAFGLPVDLDYDTDPITQFRIGVQQVFPRGDSLRHKQQKTNAQAHEKNIQQQDRLRQIRRATQNTYLELYYQVEALKIIQESRAVFHTMVEITEVHFASGTQTQQDVIEAKLELSQLDDREIRRQEAAEQARNNLAKWIGQAAYFPIATDPASLPDLLSPDDLDARLMQHPVVTLADAKIATQDVRVALAQDQYSPGYVLDLTYSKRLARNARGRVDDLLSATVLIDLPLFTGKRQDPRLSAQKARVLAARYQRKDQVRELQRQCKVQYTRWQRLGERHQLFQEKLLPEATENAQAAMLAYQSRVSDFTTLIRAELKLLQVRLKALKIAAEQQKAHAELLYFQGDVS